MGQITKNYKNDTEQFIDEVRTQMRDDLIRRSIIDILESDLKSKIEVVSKKNIKTTNSLWEDLRAPVDKIQRGYLRRPMIIFATPAFIFGGWWFNDMAYAMSELKSMW